MKVPLICFLGIILVSFSVVHLYRNSKCQDKLQVLSEALTDTIASSNVLRNQLDQRDHLYQQTKEVSDQRLKGLQTQIQVAKIKDELAQQELRFQSSRPVQHVMHRTVDSGQDIERVAKVKRRVPVTKGLIGLHKDLAFDYQFGKKHDHTYRDASPQAVIIM